MNLLSIARKLWRYKLLTVPVVLLTLCGAVYVVAVRDPVYEASTSYVLINPPAPPTPEDVARDPSLGRINADNPYTRFSDQSVIVEVLASSMANESAQRALLKAGADPRYKVERASQFGYSSPILKITAQASSPQVAVRSAKLVGTAVTSQLEQMQQAEGVASLYQIKAHRVETAEGAQLRASSQLRSLVGVLGLGAVLLFVVVSVGDALATLRMERAGRRVSSHLLADDAIWPAGEQGAGNLSALGPDDWAGLNRDSVDGPTPVQLFPDREAAAMGNGSAATRSKHRRKREGQSL